MYPPLFLGQKYDYHGDPSQDRVGYKDKLKLGCCDTLWILNLESDFNNSTSQARSSDTPKT